MNMEVIIGLIMSGTIFVLCTVLSIMLLKGKGINMLASYNTLSSEEKKEYDTEKMCKFMGTIMIILAFASLLLAVSYVTNNNWFISVFFGISLVLIVISIAYSNNGKRFKKAKFA